MSTFRIPGAFVISLAAAAMFSAVAATPVSAQQVISEPGYCAQFYPNANCQNKGPGNPYTDPNYQNYGGQAAGDQTVGLAPRRSRMHRSDSAATRMQ
jgi:hypothetical protein